MKNILLLAFFFTSCHSNEQNGKIIEKTPYELPDTSVERMTKLFPDLNTILSTVNFYKIFYIFDEIKVTVFLATPKKEGKYPCVIFNRGGNREFGAINDIAMVRLLGGPASWGYVVAASQYRGNAGVRFELFEGGQHSLAEHYDEVNHAIRTFLDAYLRDGKLWPSLEPHGN